MIVVNGNYSQTCSLLFLDRTNLHRIAFYTISSGCWWNFFPSGQVFQLSDPMLKLVINNGLLTLGRVEEWPFMIY